ncbi:MAG: phospholipase A [Campylobacterales bacterium]|nr:phospholipase A [Campylobacterales bacterium]
MNVLVALMVLLGYVAAEESVPNIEALIAQNQKKLYRSIDDMNDTDAKYTVKKMLTGLFGLKPYNENYLLPFSYREGHYTSYAPSDTYTNIEAEMQISLLYDLYTDLFGLDEVYSIAYTQKSMWQIYAKSSPFRETNYHPELLINFPLYHASDTLSLKMFQVALSHQSNGQGNITKLDYNLSAVQEISQQSWITNRSRSWNALTGMLVMQHRALFIALKGWYRFDDGRDDDNADLLKYLGYGEVSLLLPFEKGLYKARFRLNIQTGYGTMEGSFSYPLANHENVYFYAKMFSGYGETLIDYNHYITKFSIGFSFSR